MFLLLPNFGHDFAASRARYTALEGRRLSGHGVAVACPTPATHSVLIWLDAGETVQHTDELFKAF